MVPGSGTGEHAVSAEYSVAGEVEGRSVLAGLVPHGSGKALGLLTA